MYTPILLPIPFSMLGKIEKMPLARPLIWIFPAVPLSNGRKFSSISWAFSFTVYMYFKVQLLFYNQGQEICTEVPQQYPSLLCIVVLGVGFPLHCVSISPAFYVIFLFLVMQTVITQSSVIPQDDLLCV